MFVCPHLCGLFESLDGLVFLLELRLEEIDALAGAQRPPGRGRGDPAAAAGARG